MTEHPILFSGPMVRAILDGRKTQTRRVVKPQPPARNDMVNAAYCGHPNLWLPNGSIGTDTPREWKCPYGKPGDRLWVRETYTPGYDHEADHEDGPRVSIIYRADNAEETVAAPSYELAEQWERYFSEDGDEPPPWHPSIHMPRWASRITLEVTGVRVERLQGISPQDAIAEGLAHTSKDGQMVKYGIPDRDGLPGTDDDGWPWHEWRQSPVDAFESLWSRINGAGSWNANPWVWVVEFKRVEVA